MNTLNEIFVPREPRDHALTVRLPKSSSEKLKEICAKSHRSQSEVVERLINDLWEQVENASRKRNSVKGVEQS